MRSRIVKEQSETYYSPRIFFTTIIFIFELSTVNQIQKINLSEVPCNSEELIMALLPRSE
jgi:hypothetical protein